jgi:hypothetical protein
VLFIQTHQSFPLHAYPYDYFRFSREALSGLVGTQMGFGVLATDYEFPSKLLSLRLVRLPSYLNVRLYGVKTSTTPEKYAYEFATP